MMKGIRNIAVGVAVVLIAVALFWNILGAMGFLDALDVRERAMEMILTGGLGLLVVSVITAIIAQRCMSKKDAHDFEKKT